MAREKEETYDCVSSEQRGEGSLPRIGREDKDRSSSDGRTKVIGAPFSFLLV